MENCYSVQNFVLLVFVIVVGISPSLALSLFISLFSLSHFITLSLILLLSSLISSLLTKLIFQIIKLTVYFDSLPLSFHSISLPLSLSHSLSLHHSLYLVFSLLQIGPILLSFTSQLPAVLSGLPLRKLLNSTYE